MTRPALVLVLISLLIINCGCDNSAEPEKTSTSTFVPTHDWQVVPKGQKIPKGLHVRVNLETGVTEAKLIDEHEGKQSSALLSVPQAPQVAEEEPNAKLSFEESIKKIHDDPALAETINKYRTYDQIKAELNKLDLVPKLDTEIVIKLMGELRVEMGGDEPDLSRVLDLIDDLEFLGHQYDNAVEFVSQNGFRDIIYKSLNSTSSRLRDLVTIKRDILRLLGTLLQNNDKVKVHGLETGAMEILIRTLTEPNQDFMVKSRTLSALGSILRSFPMAQKKFLAQGGIQVLANFVNDDYLQLKSTILLSDLVIEHKLAALDPQLSRFYNNLDLSESIREHKWCFNLNRLLNALSSDKFDHDSVEKCLVSMDTLKDICGVDYEKQVLEQVMEKYGQLAGRSGFDENKGFYGSLRDLCGDLLHSTLLNLPTRTEL